MWINITVSCDVKPTEDEDKVILALKNIFAPEKIEIDILGDKKIIRALSSSIKSLKSFYFLIRHQKILDVTRRYLFKGISGNMVVFSVNKQAAFMKKISFCDFSERESPLGPITFTILFKNSRDLRIFIEWLAPKTINGKPIREIEIEDP